MLLWTVKLHRMMDFGMNDNTLVREIDIEILKLA